MVGSLRFEIEFPTLAPCKISCTKRRYSDPDQTGTLLCDLDSTFRNRCKGSFRGTERLELRFGERSIEGTSHRRSVHSKANLGVVSL